MKVIFINLAILQLIFSSDLLCEYEENELIEICEIVSEYRRVRLIYSNNFDVFNNLNVIPMDLGTPEYRKIYELFPRNYEEFDQLDSFLSDETKCNGDTFVYFELIVPMVNHLELDFNEKQLLFQKLFYILLQFDTHPELYQNMYPLADMISDYFRTYTEAFNTQLKLLSESDILEIFELFFRKYAGRIDVCYEYTNSYFEKDEYLSELYLKAYNNVRNEYKE